MSNNTKPVLHLVSNAHIDPVWQWRYEEGMAETLPTFWNAIRFLEDFPEYVFVHNESLLYEFVEDNDPELFSEIRRFVQQGRWIIVGGWYLQPDCNLPDGESIVRQILYGRKYFWEKFGVEPEVAYNLDSFGHNGGIPQILIKSGYKYYIHYRPENSVLNVPGDAYVWKGVDGSEVLACRPTLGWYLTEWNPIGERPGHRGFVKERIFDGVTRIQETGRDAISFWGVGNHGGGASRSELEQIREAVETFRSVEIRHSHPEAYFKAVETYRSSLPVINGSLRHCFRGCYVSSARIKRRHRECEGLLNQTERLCTFAEHFTGSPYPVEELATAWKDLLFNQFHDVVTGCSSKAVNQDSMDIFGHCSTIARNVRLRALIALTKPGPGVSGIPIFVFNPHSFTYRGPVHADFVIDYRPIYTGVAKLIVCDPNGQLLPFQSEIPSSLLGREWRKRYVFWVEVPPPQLDTLHDSKCRGTSRTRTYHKFDQQ
jgi:alpha-mannosidase